MINYPDPSIITLVAISFMLFNKTLRTKINNAYESCKDLVTISFKTPGNLNFRNIDSPNKEENLDAGDSDIVSNDNRSNQLYVNQVETNDNPSSSSLLNQLDLPRLYLNFENINLLDIKSPKDKLNLMHMRIKSYPDKSFIYSPSNYYPTKNPAENWTNKKPTTLVKPTNDQLASKVSKATKMSKYSEMAVINLTKTLLKAI